MKHTTVLFSLLAVATAANLPNANPSTVDVVARDDSHSGTNELHQSKSRGPGGQDEHEHENEHGHEKRRGGSAGAGGGGGRGGGGSRTGGSSTSSSTYRSDASALMSLNVGVLVAGVAGAGVGAVFI
jgi:hypothetical protein